VRFFLVVGECEVRRLGVSGWRCCCGRALVEILWELRWFVKGILECDDACALPFVLLGICFVTDFIMHASCDVWWSILCLPLVRVLPVISCNPCETRQIS